MAAGTTWSPICAPRPTGLRLLPAPSRSAEAAQALSESTRHLVGVLAAAPAHTTIADAGRIASNPASHPMVGGAAVTVIVHRQSTQSPAAAAVRLQRLADQVDAFAALTTAPIVAVIGAMPFSLDEIGSFVAEAAGTVPVVGLPVDELSAAVLAGRTGVSAKRLSRLPLLKASRDLAVVAHRAIGRTGAGRAVGRFAGSRAVSVNGRAPVDENDALVRYVTDRVATRMVEAIEQDEAELPRRWPRPARRRSPPTRASQQLLVGAWLSEEIAFLKPGPHAIG